MGLVFSPSFPNSALIDLGLEALWDFGRLVFTASLPFPRPENAAKRRVARRRPNANRRAGRFRHPSDIQIGARRSKTLRPSAPLAGKSRIWSRHASLRLSRPPRRNRMEPKRPTYGTHGHSPHGRGGTQSPGAPRAPYGAEV